MRRWLAFACVALGASCAATSVPAPPDPVRAPAAALATYALSRNVTPAQALALSDWFALPAGLAHVAHADREMVRLYFLAGHVDRLLNEGLLRDGLAFYAALPRATARALLETRLEKSTVLIDGVPIRLHATEDAPGLSQSSGVALRADLAAAHYLVDADPAAGRALLTDDLLARGRKWFACPLPGTVKLTLQERLNGRCGGPTGVGAQLGLLDIAFNRPADDPFDFIEQNAGNYSMVPHDALPSTALWAETFCKRAPDLNYASLCESMRRQGYGGASGDVAPVLHAAAGTTLDAAIRDWAGKLAAARPATSLPPPPRSTPFAAGDPSVFTAFPMPRALRTPPRADDMPGPPPWPKTITPLPDGFGAQRLEIHGRRAVAISQSWPLDPDGEVFGFSYWVHLSNDGGRTWQRPLYMGLVRYAPYEIVPTSHLRLLHGDVLLVEVRIDELDSLRHSPAFTVRKQDDLYLRIPLAALTRDSDGDGLTDLLEQHLLLDPHNPDTDGDGIPDGVDPMPNVAQAPAVPSSQSDFVAALLRHVLKRRAELPATGTGRLTRPVAPIVLRGDPLELAALRLPWPVLVYDGAASNRLDEVTADIFHFGMSWTLNRAGDHALATYGFDAGGGAIDFTRDAAGWHARDMGGVFY